MTIDQVAATTSGPDHRAARGVLATLVRRKLALFGMAVILVTIVLAAAAPLVAPYPYEEQLADGISEDGAPLPPNLKYLLGTDLLGWDLMSRLIYGAKSRATLPPRPMRPTSLIPLRKLRFSAAHFAPNRAPTR